MRAVVTLATALAVAALGVPGRPATSAPAAHLTAPVSEPSRVAKGPKVTVDVTKGKHRISPLIYGVNFAERGFANQVDLPVDRWVTPEEFGRWKEMGESFGIAHVEAGPLVRSSYHAGTQYRRATEAAAL